MPGPTSHSTLPSVCHTNSQHCASAGAAAPHGNNQPRRSYGALAEGTSCHLLFPLKWDPVPPGTWLIGHTLSLSSMLPLGNVPMHPL